MHLVIIIPCINEEETIGQVLSSIPQHVVGVSHIDVVVIDDGSTDNTASIARACGASVISHPNNMGVGAAFNTGVNEAIKLGADVVVNMDGDGQFDPSHINFLVEPILKNEADFVTASRFKDKDLIPCMPSIKKLGNWYIARLISLLTGQRFYDVSCGYRAYSQNTILRLNLFGKFTYTQETFLDLAFKGLRIAEIPLKIRGVREFGHSRVAGNLWRYAINSSKIILRTFRDYKPLRFFGFISGILFIISFLLGLFFFLYYLQTGRFSGNLWAGFISGFSMTLSILFFVTGLLADMFDRIRQNLEMLIYFEKRRMIHSNSEAKE